MKTITCVPAINRTRFRSHVEDYSAQRCQKDMILLHFPACSSARSLCAPWGTRRSGLASRTRSPYVLDPSGTIYELHQPEFWARHMGMKSNNPDAVHDRRTIGIDIINAGPLRLDPVNPHQLNWWPNRFGARYCGIEEPEKYVAADSGGYEYFATFPDAQIAALQFLVERLRKEFNIPAAVPPLKKRLDCDPDYFLGYRGIATLQNFRTDHFEVSPLFNWGWLGA